MQPRETKTVTPRTSVTLELSGTIATIYYDDERPGKVHQLILDHVYSTSKAIQVDVRVAVIFTVTDTSPVIPFTLKDPITVRGEYTRDARLSTITNTHQPLGFVRYNGKVYR